MADGEITNAVNSLEQAAVGVGVAAAENAAGAVLGPGGKQLVDEVLPVVLSPLMNALHALFAHIGAPVPDELKSAKDTLDKWTGGVL